MFQRSKPKPQRVQVEQLQQNIQVFLARLDVINYGIDNAGLHQQCRDVLVELLKATASLRPEVVFHSIFSHTTDYDVARAVGVLNNPYLLIMFLNLLNKIGAMDANLNLQIKQALLKKNPRGQHFWDIVAREARPQTLYYLLYYTQANGSFAGEYIYLHYFTTPASRAFSTRAADLLQHMQSLPPYIQQVRLQGIVSASNENAESGVAIARDVQKQFRASVESHIYARYIADIRQACQRLDASLRPNLFLQTVTLLDQTPVDMSLTELRWLVPVAKPNLGAEMIKRIIRLLNSTNARAPLQENAVIALQAEIGAIFRITGILASNPAEREACMDLLAIQVGCSDEDHIPSWSLGMAAVRLGCQGVFFELLQKLERECCIAHTSIMAIISLKNGDGDSFWTCVNFAGLDNKNIYHLLTQFGDLCTDEVFSLLAPRASNIFAEVGMLPTDAEQIAVLSRIVANQARDPLARLIRAATTGISAAAAAAVDVNSSQVEDKDDLMVQAANALQALHQMAEARKENRLRAAEQIRHLNSRVATTRYKWYDEDSITELREQLMYALTKLPREEDLNATQKAELMLQPIYTSESIQGWHLGMVAALAIPSVRDDASVQYSLPLLTYLEYLEKLRVEGVATQYIIDGLNSSPRNFWHCVRGVSHQFEVFYLMLIRYGHFMTSHSVEVLKAEPQIRKGVYSHIVNLADKAARRAALYRIAEGESSDPLAMLCDEYARDAQVELACTFFTGDRLFAISSYVYQIEAFFRGKLSPEWQQKVHNARQQLTALLAELSENANAFHDVNIEVQRFQDQKLCYLGIASIWLTDESAAINVKSDNALQHFMDIIMALWLEQGSLKDIQHLALDAPQKNGKSFWGWLQEKMSAVTLCQFIVKYGQLISEQGYQELRGVAAEKVFRHIIGLPTDEKTEMLRAIITREPRNYLADLCSGYVGEANRELVVLEYQQGLAASAAVSITSQPQPSAHSRLSLLHNFTQQDQRQQRGVHHESYGSINDERGGIELQSFTI